MFCANTILICYLRIFYKRTKRVNLLTVLQYIIPIPYKVAGLLFIAFGVILWILILFDSICTIWDTSKGKIAGWTWNSKKGEREPKTLKTQLGAYIVMFLLGLCSVLFGYLIFTGLV